MPIIYSPVCIHYRPVQSRRPPHAIVCSLTADVSPSVAVNKTSVCMQSSVGHSLSHRLHKNLRPDVGLGRRHTLRPIPSVCRPCPLHTGDRQCGRPTGPAAVCLSVCLRADTHTGSFPARLGELRTLYVAGHTCSGPGCVRLLRMVTLYAWAAVKDVIRRSCAHAGCHLPINAGARGAGPAEGAPYRQERTRWTLYPQYRIPMYSRGQK